jgi:acetyl esterase/lipase
MKVRSLFMLWLLGFHGFLLGQVIAQSPQPEPSKAAAEPVDVVIERDVEYGKAEEGSLKLDVLRPRAASKKPRPAIVYVHGGAWCMGDKSEGIGVLKPLVETGDYVGFTIDYRLSDVVYWPAQIHDCKAAIRWIRASANKYGVDPERIGVYGNSAGAHLACMLGLSGDRKELEGTSGSPGLSSRVSCVANKWGPTDLVTAGFVDAADWQIIGGPPEKNPERAKSASPLYNVHRHSPPFLHYYGTDDPIVHYQTQAVPFHQALKKAGADSTLVTMEGGGHGAGLPAIDTNIRAFFDKHLLGKDVEVSAEPIKMK